MSFWLDDLTYVKNIRGKPHLVRVRPDRNKSKSPSKDSSSSSSSDRNTSRLQTRPNSPAQLASVVEEVQDYEWEELIPKDKFIKLQDNFDKLAELFTGTSTSKTTQNQPSIFDKVKVTMASDNKESAKDDTLNMSTSTEDVTASMLPPGFQAAPGIYTVGGRTMALVPQQARSNIGSIGPNGFVPPGFRQQFMYRGERGPVMGEMVMQPQPIGMGFGGFNSQYDRPQPLPVEMAQVNPATSITVTRHVCAGCGTLRSRKFQAENPLEPGEQPPISYCRKCEKEIRSTDDEDDNDDECIEKKKSRRASYMKQPEPYVIIESVVVKEKHKSKKEKKEEKQEAMKQQIKAEGKAFLHTCAQCGNARSRKYQARHPIRKGETPKPGFCGKCQKEETSSENSDESSDEEKSKDSVSRSSVSRVSQDKRPSVSRQVVSVPMMDDRYVDRVVTAKKKKVRAPPSIKVVEEYSSSYDSAEEMPPPPLPQKTHKKKHSRSEKVITRTPASIAVGNYISNLIFGKKKYTSVGEHLVVDHRHKGHRYYSERPDHSKYIEDIGRGRGRGRAESQSHHHRHKRHSIYEVPSPLCQENVVTEAVSVGLRARSLDRGERTHMSRSHTASRHAAKPHSPKRKYRYNDRGDQESYYESDGNTEEIARELYKTYLSDGAPLHEESRHHQNQHEHLQHHPAPGMSHSESFDSSRFSEASAARRRERSASRPRGYMSPTIAQEPQPPRPDPVLQRPPDEVIVTTERFVFRKPELPNYRASSSAHSEPTMRDDRGGGSSDISSRKSQKFLTHDDNADYYPSEWSNNYGRHDHRDSVSSRGGSSYRESVSRPKVVVREEIRDRRSSGHYEPHRDDLSSTGAVPGSFADVDSIRSHDSYYSDRISHQPHMIRHRANTNTESISTDRTSDYTTSSGSYSSKATTSTERERGRLRYERRGDVTPRNYHTPQVPGGYISESEVTASPTDGRFGRDSERARDRDRERGRHRSPARHPSPPPRRTSLTPAGYQPPSVSDVHDSDNDTNSDHATAGIGRSRSNSGDRGRYRHFEGGEDPRELTANDRIRSRTSTRRAHRVSFDGKPDEMYTYSQVSLPTEFGEGTSATGTPGGIETREVLKDIEYVREVEHRREEEREGVRRGDERREDERRERRRRDRAIERDELKRKSKRQRERQKDLDYGYASGRG